MIVSEKSLLPLTPPDSVKHDLFGTFGNSMAPNTILS